MSLLLHGYWRSSAAYRVRMGLNLKGLSARQANLDLRTSAHRGEAYQKLNPAKLVPALETDSGILTQSSAILEWLEERYPTPALLPSAPGDRAIVRAIAGLIGSDIHPINNLRVLTSLRQDLNVSETQINNWITHWISEGFQPLETMIARYGGTFAFGDTPTLADCYLVPQVYSAERFSVDLSPYPHLRSAVDAARALPPVAQAHPNQQLDADPE